MTPVRVLKADILIVGAGPAGLTAGLYAARSGKRTLVLAGRALSRLGIEYTVENYPGFLSIGSRELLARFREQALHFGAEVVEGDAVAYGLDSSPKYVTTKDSLIEAGAVVLATGKPVPRERLIPGEDRLVGQGVSYCATCDGPLFRGAHVVAVGHSEEAREDVAALLQMGCRVHWVPGKALDGPEAEAAAALSARGAAVHDAARVTEIVGAERVEKVRLEVGGRVEELAAAAVFVFRDIPAAPLFGRAGIALDHKQCVAVDRFQRTNLPGVFAAGDVTCGGLQVVAAAGEGCVAALQALTFLRA
ncbi:MAG TPA: FAD-dependent oxidoreductase [Terriglobales bacterium]|nr:FAD-dependent oxidoreductase [Terriglobales bacterium]